MTMWGIYVAVAVWFVLSVCVMFFQAETIRRLTTECSIYSLKTNPMSSSPSSSSSDALVQRDENNQKQKRKEIAGVAVALLLGSPRWFQNRYPMMINLLLGSLPENWVVQLFYHPTNKMSAEGVSQPGILKQIKKGNVIVTPVPLEMKKMKRKDLLSSEWLWDKGIIADTVLMFGGTNGLCANSYFDLGNFTNLDYIGTPWGDNKGIGGDGAISVRNRLKVLETLKRTDKEGLNGSGGGREDVVLVRQLELQRIASKEQTLAFGMNDGSKRFDCSEKDHNCPLAYQGTLAGMSDEQRISAIEYCPEIKTVFPSLHSPACFGANPQPLQCFKFLCERGGLKCDEETSGQLKYKVGKKRSTKQGTLSIKF